MININLFDKLEIVRDGQPVLEELLNTRKTKLFLSYLILNKDREVLQKELFELLWSGQEYSNPGTALRTLLYRYRNLISDKEIAELDNSVISKRNAYQWNNDLDISIDIYDFADYSSIGVNKSIEVEKRRSCLEKAIALYKGTLISESAGEHWVVKRAVYYRDLYLSDVFEYVDILKKAGEHEKAVSVCEKAISLVGHDDLLEYELELCKNQKLDDDANAKYVEMKAQTLEMDEDVTELQNSMEADDLSSTAFVCDFETFRDIYHLQRRLLARTGETMYVALVTLGYPQGHFVEDLRHEKHMTGFLDSTKYCLRCGDSICRYSDSKLAIMFPAGSYEDAKGVLERVKSSYLSKMNPNNFVITYRVRPLKNSKE